MDVLGGVAVDVRSPAVKSKLELAPCGTCIGTCTGLHMDAERSAWNCRNCGKLNACNVVQCACRGMDQQEQQQPEHVPDDDEQEDEEEDP